MLQFSDDGVWLHMMDLWTAVIKNVNNNTI